VAGERVRPRFDARYVDRDLSQCLRAVDDVWDLMLGQDLSGFFDW
jgi:hypothetical protein